MAITSSFDKKALSNADWVIDSFFQIPETVLNW